MIAMMAVHASHVYLPISSNFCTLTALQLQPDDWVTLEYYGQVLGKMDRKESAYNAFVKSVDTVSTPTVRTH